MKIIGENIHIISKAIREAVENRDKAFIQNLAKQQMDGGAAFIDLNIGPRKKDGVEVMQWMVETVNEVTDLPLSLDTTNAAAMEAGLKLCPPKTIINSTNANPERMQVLMPMAAKYDAMLICLTLRATGLPATADERAEIAAADMMMAAAEHGLPMENIIFDPLCMTVNGTQSHGPEVIKACQVIYQDIERSPVYDHLRPVECIQFLPRGNSSPAEPGLRRHAGRRGDGLAHRRCP